MSLIYRFCLLFPIFRGALTLLLGPTNVTVESVNLHSELRWSPVTTDEDVWYTVQYQVSHDKWQGIPPCSHTRESRCPLTFDVFINVTLRVQALDGKDVSPWSQARPFKAVEQTILGPPNVTLRPNAEKSWLVILIGDPFDKRDFSKDLMHRIYYKKGNSDWMVYKDTLSPVTFDGLEVGMNYCIQVHYIWHHKLRPNSIPSIPQCVVIPESESARVIRITWVTTLIVLLLFGLLLACAYGLSKNYNKLKQLFHPPLRLPEHLREFLSGEDQLVWLPGGNASSSSLEDEHFDQISMVDIDGEVTKEEFSSACENT
ncbi:hypothetical protein GJAV_G00255010 [Gymnothorax javanicus]|nr:hypothetical protein GJAV_G00255010 [Gymnothorax javanicus]